MPVEPRIDERSRRWPDFRGGREITLPDGGAWSFFEPQAVLRDGRTGWTFDAPTDIDAILSHRFWRILAKWGRATDDSERACVVLEAAWFLLARNYAITADELEGILMDMHGWDERRQASLMGELLALVGVALARAAGLVEAA